MGKFLCFDVFLNPNFRLTRFRLVFLRLVFFPCLCRCCRCLRVGWRDARTGAGFFRGIPVFRDFPRISRVTLLACLRACSFVALAPFVLSGFGSSCVHVCVCLSGFVFFRGGLRFLELCLQQAESVSPRVRRFIIGCCPVVRGCLLSVLFCFFVLSHAWVFIIVFGALCFYMSHPLTEVTSLF